MFMKQKFLLQGKKVLVCGASQGIGRAVAKVLAESGARVFALARRAEELDSLVQDLALLNPLENHLAIACDMANLSQLESKLSPHLGFDILIHNLAGPKAGSLIEAEIAELQAALNIHLSSAHKIMQMNFPYMKKQNWGRLINIVSTSVKIPIANLGVSNTVRGAMANWSKTMANELGPFGITVNNILPGYTRTPRFESLKKNTAMSKSESEENVELAWINSTPVRRIGEPEDIAHAVLFLASREASFINGVNLPVDGGRTGSL